MEEPRNHEGCTCCVEAIHISGNIRLSAEGRLLQREKEEASQSSVRVSRYTGIDMGPCDGSARGTSFKEEGATEGSISVRKTIEPSSLSMMPSEYPEVDLSPVGIARSFYPHNGTWIISSFPSTHHLLLQSRSQSFSLLSGINHGLQPALAASL